MLKEVSPSDVTTGRPGASARVSKGLAAGLPDAQTVLRNTSLRPVRTASQRARSAARRLDAENARRSGFRAALRPALAVRRADHGDWPTGVDHRRSRAARRTGVAGCRQAPAAVAVRPSAPARLRPANCNRAEQLLVVGCRPGRVPGEASGHIGPSGCSICWFQLIQRLNSADPFRGS